MRAISFANSGGPEVLTITDIPIPKPRPEELLVKVHATALNRADLSQRRGTYPPPPGHSSLLGLEIAGEVVDCGNEAHGFKKGDRVFGLVDGGGYAEYCVIDYLMAMPIPDNWSYAEAAAVPEAFLTAQLCVFQLGELQPKQSVLLHAGGSGVGTAAMQMAHAIGAKVFFTAGSAEKINRALQLGADQGINYKTEDFEKIILEITQGTGVDVILDPVGAAYFLKNLHCLKMDGRLILIAKMSGSKTEIDLGLIMGKRLQIKGSTLRNRSLQEKREINKNFKERWLPLLRAGKIKPIIDKIFNFDQVQEAHRYMESNKNFGKIILSVMPAKAGIQKFNK